MQGDESMRREPLRLSHEPYIEQLGPLPVEGRSKLPRLREVGGEPGQQVRPEERSPDFPGKCLLTDCGVEAEQSGEVVGLGGWDEAERAPEAGNPVPRLASEHRLVSEVDRGVGIEVELEELGVLDRGRAAGEPERTCDGPALRRERLGENAESAEELHQRRTSVGKRYASRAGLSGRRSQYGRRVPSGEWRSAGRASCSQRS